MNYADWQKAVPAAIRDDSLWKMSAYRHALFLGDIAWPDASKLLKDRRTWEISGQLYRAAGSISVNLAEGYSRGTSRDRARFYEYALGSARETRDWYYKGRHILGEPVALHRVNLLAEIIKLLLIMVPDQRGAMLKEDEIPYVVNNEEADTPSLAALLAHVPMSTVEIEP